MTNEFTPHYVTFSNIIIDDIVLSDGRTFMGMLGGAGTHALIGMRLWSDKLGFVATIGLDFDDTYWAQLDRLGIDRRAIPIRENYQTARAWQLFEPDERRIEIMRTDIEEWFKFTPQFSDMPADYSQARGFHVQWGQTVEELVGLLEKLRAANPAVCLVWEPTPDHLENGEADYRTVFPYFNLISPDRGEAQTITGEATVEGMIDTLLDWGAPLVALRMGAEGSIVGTPQGQRWKLPAVPPTALIDVTGAGNAYCGGFLVGLGDGLAPLEAGLRAAVSASFGIEQFGVPEFDAAKFAEAERRLAWAREQVEVL